MLKDELYLKPLIKRSELIDAYGFSESSAKSFIRRSLRKGELVHIKKGLFTTDRYLFSLTPEEKIAFLEYLAAPIYSPSYLSSQYILSKGGVMSKGSGTITSVTTKRTNSLQNSLADYFYNSIKGPLYAGFSVRTFRNLSYNVADNGKALFDFIYFKTPIIPDYPSKISIAEKFSLNLDYITDEDLDLFKHYCEINKSPKLLRIHENLIRNR